jgi:hypothetical protein
MAAVPLPPISCKIYTPADLAGAMVAALGDRPDATWLEPSHGKGVFVEAIASLGVESERIMALDLDRTTATADSLATTMRGIDFLQWATETEMRFDRIVGNPPFISIAQLPTSSQASAASVLDLDGQPIGKGSNLWYAFVLASLRLLQKGGCLALILPSAAEFADYCSAVRRGVSKSFGRLELYQCTRPLFDEVQEGTLVVVARDYGSGPCTVVRRSFDSRASLIKGLSKSGRLNAHKCPSGSVLTATSRITFGSIAEIRLGGVTGDASFFLMNEGRRKSLRLPTGTLTPVVSKAKHLRSPTLTQDIWDGLKCSGERVWLFNPTEAWAKNPHVSNYLGLEPSKGGCNRQAYKVSIRDPWYRTPLPPLPDAFLSGMSQYGPWLCINETSAVNATNTLYVVRFSSRDPRDWYKWALALLSSAAQHQIRRIGRRYPDGLIKYEPGPLGRITLPGLRPDANHKALYCKAVSALLSGNTGQSKEVADSTLA